MSESLEVAEGLAGIAAFTSGLMGLTAFGLDSIDPVVRMIGLSLGAGMVPLGVYHTYKGLFANTHITSTEGGRDK